MGKKGSWFTTLKRAFTAPKTHQDGLHGKNVEKRRWFTKSSNNIDQTSINHGSKANQYMDSVSVQRHFAATLIQTVFRGYLARKASKALKGIVMLQAMIRGQIVRKQESFNVKCMPTLRVHTRSSVDSSRDGSRMPDDQCCIPYALEKLDCILQARKEANVSHNINELQEQANYLVQWIEADQWRRVPRKDDEVDDFLYKLQNGQSAQCIPNSPSRRSSYSPSTGQQSVTPSPIKTRPLLVHTDNPRRVKVDRNDIATPNYMAATESAKAKTRSLTSPRWTPLTPRMEQARSAKKRLSYPVPDLSHNCKVYFHGFDY